MPPLNIRKEERTTILPGIRWDDVRHGFDQACVIAGLTDFHFHDLRAYLCVLAHYARRTARHGEQPSRAYLSDHDTPLCTPIAETLDLGGTGPRSYFHPASP